MICTNCYADDGIDPDFDPFDADMTIKLCKEWRCSRCLDELEAREAAHPTTATKEST